MRYFLTTITNGASDDNSMHEVDETNAKATYQAMRAAKVRAADISLYQIDDAGVVSLVIAGKGSR